MHKQIYTWFFTDWRRKIACFAKLLFLWRKNCSEQEINEIFFNFQDYQICIMFPFLFFKGTVYVYFGDRQPWFSILWIRMKGNAFEYFPLFRSAIDSTCSNDQRRFSVKCKHFIEKKRRRTKLPTGTQNSVFLAFTNPNLEFSKCSFKRTQSFCMNYTF